MEDFLLEDGMEDGLVGCVPSKTSEAALLWSLTFDLFNGFEQIFFLNRSTRQEPLI